MYATYSHWLSLTVELVNAPRGREIEIIYLLMPVDFAGEKLKNTEFWSFWNIVFTCET